MTFTRISGAAHTRHSAQPGIAGHGCRRQPYNNALEADLVFETEAGLQCVEIKSSQTITPDLVRAGQRASRFVNEPAPAPWLVHGAPESYLREGVRCISWQRFAEPLLG